MSNIIDIVIDTIIEVKIHDGRGLLNMLLPSRGFRNADHKIKHGRIIAQANIARFRLTSYEERNRLTL